MTALEVGRSDGMIALMSSMPSYVIDGDAAAARAASTSMAYALWSWSHSQHPPYIVAAATAMNYATTQTLS